MDAYDKEYEEQYQRKTSPFADSPYIMPHAQEQRYAHSAFESAQPIKAKKNKGSGFRRLFSALLVIVLIAGSCGATALAMNAYWEEKFYLLDDVMNKRIAALQEKLDDPVGSDSNGATVPASGYTPAQVYANNARAVVAVSSEISTGSGFIISEDGYIITNYHVVEGGEQLYAVTADALEYEAKLIGYESSNDIALLKIEAEGLPYVTIGSSDDLAVGDQVAAIGNPLGELTSTLTVGYVSAKDRVVSTEGTAMNMLQTDAAINSGNSGGPLFDMNGRVVGITTAKYSGESTSGASIEGIGFAIPIDDVIDMVGDLKQYGYVTGAYLGVMVRDVEAAVVQYYDFPEGAYVVEVTEGTSAFHAGVQAKDVIVNLGGYDVTSVSELTRVLRKFKAGDETTITVFRSGSQVHLSITLDEKPRDTVMDEPVPEPTEEPTGFDYDSYDDWWNDYLFPFFGQD